MLSRNPRLVHITGLTCSRIHLARIITRNIGESASIRLIINVVRQCHVIIEANQVCPRIDPIY
jgi:hypothetical protein